MSMTFEEISNLKTGDEFWCKTSKFIVESEPVKKTAEIMEVEYEQVSLKATMVGGETARWLWTKELMHYSPSIYRYKAYMSPEDLRG